MNLPRLPNTARLPLEMIIGSERPWGGFEQFVHNQAVTVKIITVAPRQRLSLQSHAHRDELWHVIDGPADVEVDGEASTVPVGGRAWIPRGSTHRLGNSGRATVRVLEIAFGHFDEEDIERLADDYDRVGDQARVSSPVSP
jgi:mannose-6-phosphate isomerase